MFTKVLCFLTRSDMPPMAAIFAIGSGSLAVPQLSEDFSDGARDFVNKCLTRYVCQFFLPDISIKRHYKGLGMNIRVFGAV